MPDPSEGIFERMCMMRKHISLALVLVFLLSLAGGAFAEPVKLTAQQADMQINYIFSSLKTFRQDETNGAWQYTITDLDHNGRLEVIAAFLNAADHTTSVKIWELNLADSSFQECETAVPEGDSFPDIIADKADSCYDRDADTWTYLFYDHIILSENDAYAVKTAVTFQDGKASFTRLAVQHTQTVNGYQTTSYTDFNGTAISPDAYNAAGVDAVAASDRSSAAFDWFWMNEVSTVARLADSYAVFTGEKKLNNNAPVPTPPPAPAPAPQPTQRPSYLMITKNPTDESHYAGETAWFVSGANTFDTLSWTFVSPDGGEYSWQNFSNVFPYAGVAGQSSTSLSISNVSEDMDSWGAYCTFYYNSQTARTSTAYLYVNGQPDPPPPQPTPPQPGMMYGTVTDYAMSTVTINLENNTVISVLQEVCDISGDIYAGAPCEVYYNGDAPQGQNVYYVQIHGSDPQPVYGSISGTMHDITSDPYRIELANGDTVYVSPDICNLVSGNLAEGCSCTAYYTDYPASENIYSVDVYGVHMGLIVPGEDQDGGDTDDDPGDDDPGDPDNGDPG